MKDNLMLGVRKAEGTINTHCPTSQTALCSLPGFGAVLPNAGSKQLTEHREVLKRNFTLENPYLW